MIKFINTFRYSPIKDNIVCEDENMNTDSDEVVETKATTGSSYYSGYNVNSYVWQSKTIVGKLWDSIFGNDVSKENKFSSDKRMLLELFDVNYGCYASSGFKIKNGKLKNIVYKGYHEVGFLKNFSDKIYTFLPVFNVDYPVVGAKTDAQINKMINDNTKDFIQNATPNAVLDCITGFTGKYVGALGKSIEAKAPRSLYVMQDMKHTKLFFNGVKDFPKGSGHTVRFDRSFGFTLNILNPSISSYLPSTFDIEHVDMFGAAYYGGQWRGVRFYSK
jgi:hypothetical protein